MKDKFDFYQDYYFRELNRRNEINSSLSKFSYNCEKHLIIALIVIIVSLPFYSINYWLKPEKRVISISKPLPPPGQIIPEGQDPRPAY